MASEENDNGDGKRESIGNDDETSDSENDNDGKENVVGNNNKGCSCCSKCKSSKERNTNTNNANVVFVAISSVSATLLAISIALCFGSNRYLSVNLKEGDDDVIDKRDGGKFYTHYVEVEESHPVKDIR